MQAVNSLQEWIKRAVGLGSYVFKVRKLRNSAPSAKSQAELGLAKICEDKC